MICTPLSERTIKKTRKNHRCGWCDEQIDSGSTGIPYRSYIWEDGPVSEWMHPECRGALNRASYDEIEEGWTPGDFHRGTTDNINDDPLPDVWRPSISRKDEYTYV